MPGAATSGRLAITKKFPLTKRLVRLDEDDRASTNLLFDLVRASIGHDKWFREIGLFMIVPENGSLQHGMKRITNFFYDGEIIRDAVIITFVEPEAKAETPKRKARAAEPVVA